jgi:hypothetical protein
LALIKPDWGERKAMTIIRIPAGELATFISGKTVEQYSKQLVKFRSGGFQIRFRDFDPK